jgi:hypothetical protein
MASKRWEKVGRQELRSTAYKQEIDLCPFLNLTLRHSLNFIVLFSDRKVWLTMNALYLLKSMD